MPRPLAICIENLNPSSETEHFVRCVAKAGRGDGLALDTLGNPMFGDHRAVACELVVSLDERLLLVRHEGAPTIVVHRAGRSLEAPVGQRVVLVDQDSIEVGTQHLRVHIHGLAAELHAPTPFVPKSLNRSGRSPACWTESTKVEEHGGTSVQPRALKTAASVAAVVAMSMGAAGCKEIASLFDGGPIDVRMSPPEPPPAPPIPDAGTAASTGASAQPVGTASTPPALAPSASVPKPPPIEVRDNPPEYAPEVPPKK